MASAAPGASQEWVRVTSVVISATEERAAALLRALHRQTFRPQEILCFCRAAASEALRHTVPSAQFPLHRGGSEPTGGIAHAALASAASTCVTARDRTVTALEWLLAREQSGGRIFDTHFVMILTHDIPATFVASALRRVIMAQRAQQNEEGGAETEAAVYYVVNHAAVFIPITRLKAALRDMVAHVPCAGDADAAQAQAQAKEKEKAR